MSNENPIQPSLAGPGYRMPPRRDTGPRPQVMQQVVESPGIQNAAILEQMFNQMPEWAVVMSQQMTYLLIENMALKTVLQGRHVVTEMELSQTRSELAAATEQMIQGAIQQLGRQFAQRPTVPPQPQDPNDPRRSPTKP
jgi:hypothetical protein